MTSGRREKNDGPRQPAAYTYQLTLTHGDDDDNISPHDPDRNVSFVHLTLSVSVGCRPMCVCECFPPLYLHHQRKSQSKKKMYEKMRSSPSSSALHTHIWEVNFWI